MTVESPHRTPLSPRAILSWLASFSTGDRRQAYITQLLSALVTVPRYGDD